MAKGEVKEFGAKRLTTEYVMMEAPGFVAILDSYGVAVRRFKRDNESGRWLVMNSLSQWVALLETKGDVDQFIKEYVKRKKDEDDNDCRPSVESK